MTPGIAYQDQQSDGRPNTQEQQIENQRLHKLATRKRAEREHGDDAYKVSESREFLGHRVGLVDGQCNHGCERASVVVASV